jgi:hypothetical protein
MRVGTEFNWLRTETSDGLLEYSNEPFDFDQWPKIFLTPCFGMEIFWKVVAWNGGRREITLG